MVEDQGAYFSRLINPRAYGIVTQDIISRKAYPMVVDKKSVDAKANYVNKMLNTYIDQSANIAVSSKVSNRSVIGPKTNMGANCTVEYSSIGSNCKIANNVTLINCHIHNQVKIEEGCHLENVIV